MRGVGQLDQGSRQTDHIDDPVVDQGLHDRTGAQTSGERQWGGGHLADAGREPREVGVLRRPGLVGADPERAGGLPDLSPVALAAGLVGLLSGPFLIADPTARYVVLAADLVAIAFGALGVWVSFKRFARLDYAVAALVMGGISLFLWIQYVSDPPQGGT